MSKENNGINILFVNNGADEELLKSIANDELHEYNTEELSKALDKAKLVQKEVQVKGKNGQTFTRKQWVKAGEEQTQKDSGIRTNTGGLKYKGCTISKVFKHGQTYYKIEGNNELFSKESDAKLYIDKTSDQKPEKKITKDSSKTSAVTSYKGKTLSEMRVLFNGKTAKDVQEEKGRIFREMGSPSGSGTEQYKKFKEAVSPLDQLINDTINNGSGDTSGDYSKLLGTSIVRAKSEDKTTVKKDAGKLPDSKPTGTNVINKKNGTVSHTDSVGNDFKIYTDDQSGTVNMVGKFNPNYKSKFIEGMQKKGYEIDKEHTGKLPDGNEQLSFKKASQNTDISTKLSKDEAKKKTQSITSSVGKTDTERKELMSQAKAQGITWKEHTHTAINWMRCCMAMNKHFEEGGNWNNNTKSTSNVSVNKNETTTGSSIKRDKSVKTSTPLISSNQLNILKNSNNLAYDLNGRVQDKILIESFGTASGSVITKKFSNDTIISVLSGEKTVASLEKDNNWKPYVVPSNSTEKEPEKEEQKFKNVQLNENENKVRFDFNNRHYEFEVGQTVQSVLSDGTKASDKVSILNFGNTIKILVGPVQIGKGHPYLTEFRIKGKLAGTDLVSVK